MLLGEDGASPNARHSLAYWRRNGSSERLGDGRCAPRQLRRLREDDPAWPQRLGSNCAADGSTGGRWSRALRLTGVSTMVERSDRSTATSMRHQCDVCRVDAACNGLGVGDRARPFEYAPRHTAESLFEPTPRCATLHDVGAAA